MSIFIVLFVVLLIAWLLGWFASHVTSALIHILLVVAVIALILHFVRGTARTPLRHCGSPCALADNLPSPDVQHLSSPTRRG